ncbi:MAG: class I SAM-dependent RNA methyltransferase, partial [Alphaproteobacteria bacterium]
MSNFDAELTIAEIGAKGDGIAKLEGGKRVFVPFTAAGDRVRVRVGKSAAAGDSMQARLVEVLEPGPGRGKAVCKHFTVCGGCALQHLTPEAYDAWKLELVRAALDREGVENVALRPLLKSPPGSRRRADFTAVRRKDDVILGFNGRASNQVVDLLECPVTMPSIVALLPGLRALLMDVLPLAAHAEIVVNALTHGLDVLVTTTAELAKHHERLARFAREAGLVRLSRAHPKSRQGEIVVALRPATVRFGAVEIAVPPATFLQATREGEAALAKLVVEACAGSR